ncbi:MAG: deoxyribodipyrimidine photolyase-related protein [Cellvibrionaceae bacterium]|jgi:deoxyribodipyrimidine photolyase-related protein
MISGKKSHQTLRLILGDQLNAEHSWYNNKDSSILYVIAELYQETLYVKHHGQKLAAFFLAMAEFSAALRKAGHHILYLTLDDTKSFETLDDLILDLIKKYKISNFEYQRPDEYRLLQQLNNLKLPSSVQVSRVDTEHFLLPFAEINDYFQEKKHRKMEFFYRKMRRRFNLLMEGDKPLGGKWNYDADNRNRLKKNDIEALPEPLVFKNDISDIRQRLQRHKVDTIGKLENSLIWPKNQRQSLKLLRFFCEHCLPKFGIFQDAMTCESNHRWSLYHSRLSFALNAKILHPKTVLDEAVKAFEKAKGGIELSQIEGFVRQILGWREYVRGVYWVNMPDYKKHNRLRAIRNIPDYFWTGETRMNCMGQAISQSLEFAYAHHIQRLMITGNFSLLSGIHPDQVDQWYLGIYIDAIEWVELPNTRGMSQFADGGIVATKPYAASGNYINKMSDYCKNCHYNVKQKTETSACPFNSLYWDFMNRHRESLEKNPRIGMIYKNWDKQDKKPILDRAKWCLDHLDEL